MGGVCCCCCAPDATESEKAPLFGHSQADTRFSTTITKKSAARASDGMSRGGAGSAAPPTQPAKSGGGGGGGGGDQKKSGGESAAKKKSEVKPVFNRRFTAIVTHIPKNELSNLERLFQSVTNRSDLDGTLNRSQFEQIFLPYFPDVGGALSSRLFDSLVAASHTKNKSTLASGGAAGGGGGGDGKAVAVSGTDTVTFRALCTAVYMWCEGSMADKLKLLFEMWDTDRNGVLSREELKRMISTITKSSAATGALLMRDATKSEQFLKGMREEEGGGGGIGSDENMERFTEQLDDDLECTHVCVI